MTVTDRLGFLAFNGDGVFSTSTSLLDGEDELLTDDVVVSRISLDMGAWTLPAGFLGGRPGRLVASLPAGKAGPASLAEAAGVEVAACFFGRPGPLRLGAVDSTGPAGGSEAGCLERASGAGRSSSLLLLSDSDSRFRLALAFDWGCLTLRPDGAFEPDEGKLGLGVT